MKELIIYDNNGIIAVNKPAGFETISTQPGGNCVTRSLKRELNLNFIEPAHRLDRDTTGVQLFARDNATLKKLEEFFRVRTVKKHYLAICYKIPHNKEGIIRRNLSKWLGGHKPVKVVKGGGGLVAETEYQLLARNKEFPASLILFTPHQGRTHQIRVHAEALGRPILGDHQYGDRPANKILKDSSGLSRQALHAWRLVIPPINSINQAIAIEAPIVGDMQIACDLLFPNWRDITTL